MVGHPSPDLMLVFLQEMHVMCVSLLRFSNPAADPGYWFCPLWDATGFEVLSSNPGLAGLQRKEGGVVKAPHWVAGDLSLTLHSTTRKYHC